MFTIKLFAAFAVVYGIYQFMMGFNTFTFKEARYRFFTIQSYGWYAASYIAMYAGFHMIKSNWEGDPLNGIIVLIIGLWIFITQIRNNFRHTKPLVAISGSLAQCVLYIPLTIIGLFALFIAMAAASRIRPVYSINS